MGLIAALLLAGCKDPDAGPDALRVYARASIDLRGVRPSYGEAQIVLGDPSALDERVAALADDVRFGWQAALLYAPTWGTRVDQTDVFRLNLGMPDETTFLASVGEEPLRVVAWIADHDLPWTDVVRGEWTMADDVLATRFPVDYPPGETGWRQVHYTDGRPMAGILASSGMWWRYGTTMNNANRGRVNALSRVLMCRNYLDQQVAFPPDLDLTDEAAIQEAVRTNEVCLGCHRDIDPIGAYLWGFYAEFSNDPMDWAYYHPDREHNWETFEVAPGYFGTAGTDLDDLGRAMAADGRIVDCVVRRTWEGLLQREAGPDDGDTLRRHREAFIGGGLTLRALFRSVAEDGRYRSFDGDAAAAKLLTPDQCASVVEDLTGFRFVADGHDAVAQDFLAFRSLAGGARTSGVNIPTPTPTMAVVQERIAQAAAAWVVARDLEDPGGARLLTGVTTSTAAGSEAFVAQVQALHLRVLGEVVAADGYEVLSATELWQAVEADEGAEAAWVAVITGLLRDPAFLVY